MISTNDNLTFASQSVAAIGPAPTTPPTSPSLPQTLWHAWKAYGHRTATYQTELLLSLVYFLVLGPCGLLAKVSGKTLMDLSGAGRDSYWLPRKPGDKTLAGMERQF